MPVLTLRQGDRLCDAIRASGFDLEFDAGEVRLVYVDDGAVAVAVPATGEPGRDLGAMMNAITARPAVPCAGEA